MTMTRKTWYKVGPLDTYCLYSTFIDFRGCTPEAIEDNVLLENIKITLKYDEIDFEFNNLGSIGNTAMNVIGPTLLKEQEAVLVEEFRKLIQENFNSLIC